MFRVRVTVPGFAGFGPRISLSPECRQNLKRATNAGPLNEKPSNGPAASLVVLEVAIEQQHVSPAEGVAHAAHQVPGQVGISGADVRVIRQRPAGFPQGDLAANPDNRILQVDVPADTPVGGQDHRVVRQRDIGSQAPTRGQFDAEITGAREWSGE